jgi:hypothetical protein
VCSREDAYESNSNDEDDGAKDDKSKMARTEGSNYSSIDTSQCLVLIPSDRKVGEYLRTGFATVGAEESLKQSEEKARIPVERLQ